MATSLELDDRLATALKASGNRVTTQRLLIHRHLAREEQHVTAEQTLRAVEHALPGISAQTVYSTLELFEELGLLHRVHVASGPAVFDTRTTPHHHAACMSCGLVMDLEEHVDDGALRAAARAAGFEPQRSETVIEGRCAHCRAAQS